MSEYDQLLRALKRIDTPYNLTIPKMHEPTIKDKYKVTRETRVIPIAVEHEGDRIQWA